jgi:hypothetical protein
MTADSDKPGERIKAPPVSDEILKGWISACDPREPIEPGDRRYLDLDRIEIDGRQVRLRGDVHVDGLLDVITLSEGVSCQLFSGFSGTGKSTELRRLKQHLEETGYQVLLADAQEYHDLNHELTIEDLTVIIAGAFGDAAMQRLGKDKDPGREGYWQRLQDFLEQDVEISGLKVPGVPDLKVGIKHANPFWLEVRDALAMAPGRLREHCHRYIQRCVDALARAAPQSRGVVFIFDSLERLSAQLPQFREVMESAARVLTNNPQTLRLPGCHVVYSVPPYVQLVSPGLKTLYDRAGLVLPAIKVAERGPDGAPFRPGIETMMRLIGLRIPIEQVFGDRRDLLERLIVYSGGHVRMLIAFVRELLYRSHRRGLPPDDEEIEQIVQPYREQYSLVISRESLPLLLRILDQGTVEGLGEQEYGFLGRFMDSYVVLCYRNGDGWYEVHSLARQLVSRLAAAIAAPTRNGT